jgi:hypothetical protein
MYPRLYSLGIAVVLHAKLSVKLNEDLSVCGTAEL